ncbi:ATP-dependent DNA helicase Srs2p [[Candida] jaroonii]|uniref:ATP-dependent DNA helicase Srs2p n=1 Tax=[Candida] jaroonii TaxID=467808 RepID=A0ACA9Y2L9_9ASCO|nr:ATP-dependent DNA helicase Srs2p [[Candida] jaroonii]
MSMDISTVLQSLNEKQKESVISPSNGRLQIVAGPGTGKTKVLISRVAKLLLVDNIEPYQLIVTTFTKKAANEMIERLTPILKGTSIDPTKILMGTFHSICYRIIRRYGMKADLSNYTIADERDSNQILSDILKNLNNEEIDHLDSLDGNEMFKTGKDGKYHGYDPKVFKRQISKLKSSGITYKKYLTAPSSNKCLRFIYEKYQLQLKKEFLLDFDDCLLECYDLISKYPVLNFVQHVLVDEFQDTNEIQLRLMYEFARGHPTNPLFQNNLTIVGDPDQSIYGFRDAQSANFKKMKKYYESKNLPVSVITLDENYRSTKDILSISETIMRQQKDRVTKQLSSQIENSFKPVHKTCNSSKQEARWIAYQITYLTSLPDSVVRYQDISILVRAAYQTRAIENELVKCRIPYFMIRGKAFWDRKEVVAMLDYLRVIGNPLDRIAYLRTINFPKRGIGEKTLEDLAKRLEAVDLNSYNSHDALKIIAEQLSNKNQKSLLSYLEFIEDARIKMIEVETMDLGEERERLLDEFFDFVYVKSGLKDQFKKEESHEQNIMEVKKQLLEFSPRDEDEFPVYLNDQGQPSQVPEMEEDNQSFLSKFIVSLGLFEHSEDKEDEQGSNKVSLSTIHGSKGLEWPVVLIPGVSEGLLPASFAIKSGGEEEIDEERRCFYVATTRAKTLLYLTSCVEEEKSWYNNKPSSVSRFISNLDHKFTKTQKCFSDWETLKSFYCIRGKAHPNSFDLHIFNKGYKEQLFPFLTGDLQRIETMNYKPQDFIVHNPEPKSEFGFGFSSSLSKARYALSKDRYAYDLGDSEPATEEIDFSEPKFPKRAPMSSNKAPGSSYIKNLYAGAAFKKHKPSMAPAYNPVKINSLAPKGKKAPAYIPDRRKKA